MAEGAEIVPPPNSLTPVGEIVMYAGPSSGPAGSIIEAESAPEGYLFCNGAAVNISDYQDLAKHIEQKFGSKNHFGGDGVTTFAIPSLQGMFAKGASSSETVGAYGGSSNHSHSLNAHTHDLQNHSHEINSNHTHGMSHSHSGIFNHRHEAGGFFLSALSAVNWVGNFANTTLIQVAWASHNHTITGLTSMNTVNSGTGSRTATGAAGSVTTNSTSAATTNSTSPAVPTLNNVSPSNNGLPPYIALHYMVKY